MDRWRVSNRWTAVFGAQVVSAARDVLVTNAITGAVTNPDARYTTVNPRAGLIASLNDAGEVYGNVSRLFEAPTTFQLIDQVRGGNATLDPMSGTVAEVGWRSRTGQSQGVRVTWDIAAYYARISNEILSLDDPNAPGNSLVTNIDKTTHAGIEALVGSSFSLGDKHRIDPQVSVTLNRFHFADDPVYGDESSARRTHDMPRVERCCTDMPAASMPVPRSISSASGMRTSPIPTPSIATD